jgi:hypothetical protein
MIILLVFWRNIHTDTFRSRLNNQLLKRLKIYFMDVKSAGVYYLISSMIYLFLLFSMFVPLTWIPA